MQGTIATMATPLLADAHGQYLPRLVQHDLESFFWTTLFGLVNFSGPFQQVKDWSKVAGGSTGGQNDSANTTIVPPAWMRPGLAEYTFHDVHASRGSPIDFGQLGILPGLHSALLGGPSDPVRHGEDVQHLHVT